MFLDAVNGYASIVGQIWSGLSTVENFPIPGINFQQFIVISFLVIVIIDVLRLLFGIFGTTFVISPIKDSFSSAHTNFVKNIKNVKNTKSSSNTKKR